MAIFILLFYIIVYFLVNFSSMQNFIGWLAFISSIVGVIYFSYSAWQAIRKRIVLFENKIYVQGDFGDEKTKLQYEIDIEYINIQNISLVVDSKNSLNKDVVFVITPMINSVLHLSDGEEARINLYYYSKKQKIEIINYIIERIKIIDPIFTNRSGQELLEELKKRKI